MKQKPPSLFRKALAEAFNDIRVGSWPAILFNVGVPILSLLITGAVTQSVSWSSACALGTTALAFPIFFLWKLFVGLPHRELALRTAEVQQLRTELEIKSLNRHDRRLWIRFRNTFGPSLRDFLRHQDFNLPAEGWLMEAITDFADDWHGPEASFHDPALDAKLTDCKTAAMALTDDLVQTWPTANPLMRSPLTSADRAGALSEQTRQRIDRLNAGKAKLLIAVDAVTREAIRQGQSPIPPVKTGAKTKATAK